MSQILSHRFFDPSLAPPPEERREKYHAFLSHAQADAAGTAAALCGAYAQLGIPCWIAREEQVEPQAMRRGIEDSDVFLLVLSRYVLGKSSQQQEALEAIRRNKKVQILLEEDENFFPFDLEAWEASKHPMSEQDRTWTRLRVSTIEAELVEQLRRASDTIASHDNDAEEDAHTVIASLRHDKKRLMAILGSQSPLGKRMVESSAGGAMVEVPDEICKMIDENLPNAITYRRSGVKKESMMRELCLSNGFGLLPS